MRGEVEEGGRGADLSWVVVPQLVVQPVGVGLLPLDLGDDVKHVRVGAAGAGAPLAVRLAVRLAAAVVWGTQATQ